MTDETREKIHQITDYINKDSLFFLDEFDWGYITGGFKNEEMSELIFNINNDDSVKWAIDCISQSWYEALEHFDPICYDEDNYPKFNESFSINYVLEKIRKKRNIHIRLEKHKKNTSDDVLETNHDNSLLIRNQARIAELEEENKDLKEQLGKVRNQEKGISLGLNQAQAALFGLALANTFDFNYTNKKKDLAPLLHKLFGWGEAKLAYYLTSGCEKEERDELANLFKDLCPSLYATIMNRGELPQ